MICRTSLMTALSRSIDPRTLRSASGLCGGRRSGPGDPEDMATSCRRARWAGAGRGWSVPRPAPAGLPLPGRLRNDHDPEGGLDLVPEDHPDRPLAEVPERLVHLDH